MTAPRLGQHPVAGTDRLLTEPPPGAATDSAEEWDGGRHAGPLRNVRSHKPVVAAVVVLGLIVLFTFVGPHFYHTNQVVANINAVSLAPGGAHLLGTDYQGFDILGRLMAGGAATLEIGLGVGILSPLLGMVYGALSGFFGGVVDGVLMRIVDVTLAIPTIFFLVFVASVVEPSVLILIAVLAVLSWPVPARLIRGEVLSLRTREFVEAARVAGARSGRILLRHIVPNAIGTLVVNATFQVADAILVVSTLGFLGLGLPPPTVTWGGMLAGGVNYLDAGYWWMVWPALIMIVVTIVSINLIGDALHDAVEVRLQRR